MTESIEQQIDRYTKTHGEQFRPMISAALRWLDENEAEWDLENPIDRNAFIEQLVRNIAQD